MVLIAVVVLAQMQSLKHVGYRNQSAWGVGIMDTALRYRYCRRTKVDSNVVDTVEKAVNIAVLKHSLDACQRSCRWAGCRWSVPGRHPSPLSAIHSCGTVLSLSNVCAVQRGRPQMGWASVVGSGAMGLALFITTAKLLLQQPPDGGRGGEGGGWAGAEAGEGSPVALSYGTYGVMGVYGAALGRLGRWWPANTEVVASGGLSNAMVCGCGCGCGCNVWGCWSEVSEGCEHADACALGRVVRATWGRSKGVDGVVTHVCPCDVRLGKGAREKTHMGHLGYGKRGRGWWQLDKSAQLTTLRSCQSMVAYLR